MNATANISASHVGDAVTLMEVFLKTASPTSMGLSVHP